MDRPVAFFARNEVIPQANVGEGAANHDFVIATPGAIRVELRWPDPLLDQVSPCRAISRDAPGGRDVIGRHGVADEHQYAGALNVRRWTELVRQILEEGRIL